MVIESELPDFGLGKTPDRTAATCASDPDKPDATRSLTPLAAVYEKA